MVIATINFLGIEFDLVLHRRRPRLPSSPPPAAIETTLEDVHAPSLPSAKPSLRLVRSSEAA